MGFWSWLSGPSKFQLDYPLVTGCFNVPADEMSALTAQFGKASGHEAALTVGPITADPKRPWYVVQHFGVELGYSRRQAQAFLHEANHALSKAKRVKDTTDAHDGRTLA